MGYVQEPQHEPVHESAGRDGLITSGEDDRSDTQAQDDAALLVSRGDYADEISY